MEIETKYLPENLTYDDYSNDYIIDLYASLPSDEGSTILYLERFFEKAEEINVDMIELRQRYEKSKAEAEEYNRRNSIGFPAIENLDLFWDFVPERPEPLIEGVLRRGHKMLISGASKAGKSFCLMELAIAIAEGTKWLGFQCKKGRVLYINLEIDRASCINRFIDIYKALGYEHKPKNIESIEIWNLRGRAVELADLTGPLIEKVKGRQLDAIIFDPIYKIMMGDENSASDMGKFCNEFDKVATQTGCSVIYAHHHAKGAMGARKAQDRASGSGVFARDPDAILDIIELNIPDELQNQILPPSGSNLYCSPWRLEGSLREFPNFKPINFWYDYPLHVLDKNGQLDRLYANGDPKNNLNKSPNHQKTLDLEQLEEVYSKLKTKPTNSANLKAMAEKLGITDKTLRKKIADEFDEYFFNDKGNVYHK